MIIIIHARARKVVYRYEFGVKRKKWIFFVNLL